VFDQSGVAGIDLSSHFALGFLRIDQWTRGTYADGMRWDALFEDMEAQFAAENRLQQESEIAERVRIDAAGVGMADRLRASINLRVTVHLVSGSTLSGLLSHAGSQLLVLNEQQHQVLVPYAAIGRCSGLARHAVTEPSIVRQSPGLGSALRALARDRSHLALTLAGGSQGETTLHGVIDRVGSDYVDLAVTAPGEARRAANVIEMAAVPFTALCAIRSIPGAVA
jgi:sRNA-binding regulator protein Hfq